MGEVTLISSDALRAYSRGILEGLEVPPEQAQIVAESLVDADLRGVASHGVNLLALYAARIRAGSMRPVARTDVVADEGSTLQIDGGLGPGQVTGLFAIDQAAERAREHGISAVAVRDSTHLGALGYYTLRAAERGIFAMAFQNGPTLVPPYGGITPIFSTNPISYAVPAGEEPPIVFDVASTAVAGNKLVLARKQGKSLPEGWANDAEGRPTTDPERASMSGLQWFGGHKGFGIAFLVEVLSGVLTGCAFGRQEGESALTTGALRVAKGYLFLALDVGRFLPLPDFRERVDVLIRDVHASEPAEGFERTYVPGEIEHHRRLERLEAGIPLPRELAEELGGLGAELGLGALSE